MELETYYPTFPPKVKTYVLYCSKKDAVLIKIFAAKYAAKHFLDYLLKDDKVIYERTIILKTKSGIQVKCNDLEDLLDYKFNSLEAEWELPPNYKEVIHLFKGEEIIKEKTPVIKEKTPVIKKLGVKRRKKIEGIVTVAMIADDLEISPRKARVALRQALKAKAIAKPKDGWKWTEKEATKIAPIIKRYVK